MSPKTIGGRRAKLLANGVLIGWATGVSVTESQGVLRSDVLGEVYSQEIIPNGRTVQLSAQTIRIKRGSMKEYGLMARGDTATVMNVVPIDFVIYDILPEDEGPIEVITGCVCEQRSFNVDLNGAFTENASFQGIRSLDEGEI